MNRLAVYSYLTRYPNGNARSGKVFTEQTESLLEKWDKVTQQEAARKQAGPLFQDLMSGWKQPSQIIVHDKVFLLLFLASTLTHAQGCALWPTSLTHANTIIQCICHFFLFQMVKFQTFLLLSFFLTTSAIPLWYKHLAKPSTHPNDIPSTNKLSKHSSYEDSSSYEDNDDEVPGVLYSLSHATGDCKLDEDVFSICYLCGKVVESEKVLIGCCEQSGLVRDFCFELLS